MSELKPCEVGQIKFDANGNREGTIVGSAHWPKLVANSGLNEKWLSLTLAPVRTLDKADWSLLDATKDSLREHMQALREKDNELSAAKARIAELEALIADIKAWDIDKAAEEIARGQDLNLQVPPEIRKRMQALLNKEGS